MTNNEVKISILREAKKHVADGTIAFLCIAIGEQDSLENVSKDELDLAKSELLEYIETAIKGHFTLCNWVIANRPVPLQVQNDHELYTIYFRNVRLMWIDWIILQLSQEK
jgi:hypothetical protein